MWCTQYLEMVLSRKLTVWEFRKEDRDERWRSPLSVGRLRGQQDAGDGQAVILSRREREYSRVSKSVSDGDPHV